MFLFLSLPSNDDIRIPVLCGIPVLRDMLQVVILGLPLYMKKNDVLVFLELTVESRLRDVLLSLIRLKVEIITP